MGTIVVNTNMTLDGVVENPTGEDGPGGGWFNATSDTDHEAWAGFEFEESLHTDALLLGRETDAWFAQRWSDRQGAWADRLNGLPKYVVSSTLTETAWANGTVLKGDVAEAVARLKAEVDGRIVVFGSGTLVQTLLEHELVDELRLFVFGALVGRGGRMFDAGSPATLRLTRAERIGDGMLFVAYDVVHG
ncbi:dihydrofolate reductase family protein [Nocardioides sp.]|uniref:dihydrofolate reductase family protein n=1 Tax=Nocardioides sp. TaxID=35761 RepID=UPI003D13A901